MDRFIGKMLENRYEIVEIIGVGGMAVVYKAKCHRLNRYVAVKVLKDEYAIDSDFRRRFYDESQAVAMLSHPNIVAVYDVSRTEGVEYIVMELIDGITLKEYMGRRGPLSFNEVTFFSMQIAKALEHAHSRGIVHRDIKPQNIMLLRDGTVKVADFGIARHIAKQETYNMGEAIGSVHYVSPEQARGSYVDNRTDIYSLGVVMYEMLTGRLPFEGETPISIALQHINSIALPPSDFVPEIPPALEGITMRAMNPSLNKRYLSAAELLTDLEYFKNDPNVKIDIPKGENPVDDKPADQMSRTRRLNNTGEVESRPDSGGREVQTQRIRRVSSNAPSDAANWDDEDKPVKKQKDKKSSMLPASLLFSVIAIVLFFVGAIYFTLKIIDPFGNPDNTKIEVPQLTGISYDLLLSDDKYKDIRQNFVIVKGEEKYNDDVAFGVISNQYPPKGRLVNEGTEIVVDISKGTKQSVMENYEGLNYSAVFNKLKDMGMIVDVVEENHDTLAKGSVIRTVPDKDAFLKSGDLVMIYVSKGKELERVKVPDLTGLTENEAIIKLKEHKLVLGTVDPEERAESEIIGKIVWQQLPADSEVDEGMAISVRVAVPSEVTLPPATDPTTAPPLPTDPSATGERIIPPEYAGGTEKRFKFNIVDTDGPVTVTVSVNGKLQYRGTHYTSEGSITVTLIALVDIYSDLATVTIVQNGVTTFEQAVSFS